MSGEKEEIKVYFPDVDDKKNENRPVQMPHIVNMEGKDYYLKTDTSGKTQYLCEYYDAEGNRHTSFEEPLKLFDAIRQKAADPNVVVSQGGLTYSERSKVTEEDILPRLPKTEEDLPSGYLKGGTKLVLATFNDDPCGGPSVFNKAVLYKDGERVKITPDIVPDEILHISRASFKTLEERNDLAAPEWTNRGVSAHYANTVMRNAEGTPQNVLKLLDNMEKVSEEAAEAALNIMRQREVQFDANEVQIRGGIKQQMQR